MKKTFTYTIGPGDADQTTEQYLRSHGYSKKLMIRLKNTPDGLCNESGKIYTTHRLTEGEQLQITIEDTESSDGILPVPLPLSIVYEDDDLLVINKAANMPIHPSQGNYDNTLANAVAYYFHQKGERFVYRAINRLDRDTTGLLIIAKHMLSACLLSDMVARREIHREYLAIADGLVPEAGCVTAPIARQDASVITRCVDWERGESACTHFTRLSYSKAHDCSLVSLTLDTGRTHQIRVHMSHIGHPLFGDFLYHPDYRYIKRQSLHSWKLSFSHPLTQKPMYFYAPLPEDMWFMFSPSQTMKQPTP